MLRYTREAGSHARFEQPIQEMQGGERARVRATMKRMWYCIMELVLALFIPILVGTPILLMGLENIALVVGLLSLVVSILACAYSLGKGSSHELVQVIEVNSSTKDIKDWRYKKGKATYTQTIKMQDIIRFHLDVFDQPAAYIWKLHALLQHEKKPYLLVLKFMTKDPSNILDVAAMKGMFNEMVDDMISLVRSGQPSVNAAINHDPANALERGTIPANDVNTARLLGGGILMVFGLIGLAVGGAWLAFMWMYGGVMFSVVAVCAILFVVGFRIYRKEARKKIF